MMSTTFAGYKPYAGAFAGRDRGNLLSSSTGTVTGHALKSVQERGQLFAVQGDEVYENQIIGISAKADDLKVNPCKAKQLTNMRSAGADDKTKATPAISSLPLPRTPYESSHA